MILRFFFFKMRIDSMFGLGPHDKDFSILHSMRVPDNLCLVACVGLVLLAEMPCWYSFVFVYSY